MGSTTRQTWPDETPEQVIARTRAEHGDRAAEVVAATIDQPVPHGGGPRRRTAGVRAKRGSGLAEGDATVASAASDRTSPVGTYRACPRCRRPQMDAGLCRTCRGQVTRNTGTGRGIGDVPDAEAAEIRRKVRGFADPAQVARDHNLPVASVRAIMRRPR